jgi:hypothetical protein
MTRQLFALASLQSREVNASTSGPLAAAVELESEQSRHEIDSNYAKKASEGASKSDYVCQPECALFVAY